MNEVKEEFGFNTLTGRMAIMVGFMGTSGSGKTRSALRWATGAASVAGGPVVVVDTESGRALHHHDRHGGGLKFEHIHFEPPHSTMRYLAAINYAIENGAGAIVVDSYSHEHEGVGGALEQHAAALQAMGGNDAMSAMAWMKPKQNRKAVTNRLLQKRIPIAFCFRAKEGIDFNYHDPKTLKRKPRGQGLVPIGDLQFFYDMTVNFIFRAGCDGVPDWHPDIRTEPVTRSLAKCPGQFRELLGYDASRPPQVNEDLGRAMALWADGKPFSGKAALMTELFTTYDARIAGAEDQKALEAIAKEILGDALLTSTDKQELRRTFADRRDELKA